MKSETLYIKNISKRLNDGYELKSISIRAFKGEILGVFGRNNSGILTLSKILSGEIYYDEGCIAICEKQIHAVNADTLISAGVSHITALPKLLIESTVAESICTIFPPVLHKKLFNYKTLVKASGEILKKYDIDIDPNEKIYRLMPYEQSMVEILRAVVMNCKVIILENPFHPYDEKIYDIYYRILKIIASEGKSVLIAGTDPKIPLDIFDRIIIIDGGKVQGVFHKNMFTSTMLNNLFHYEKKIKPKKEMRRENKHRLVLEIKNLELQSCGIDYVYLKEGEAIAFIDTEGNTFDPVVRLFNGEAEYNGEIFIDGTTIRLRSRYEAVKNGIGFITKYDDDQMVFNNLTIEDNILLMKFREFSRFGLINRRWCSFAAREYLAEYSIPPEFGKFLPPQVNSYIRSFIPEIKWDVVKPKIILIANILSGMDSQMRTAIYDYICRLKAKGTGFILCTNNDYDLSNLVDRLYVFKNIGVGEQRI
jgi:ribose transport system ATP-binding protein